MRESRDCKDPWKGQKNTDRRRWSCSARRDGIIPRRTETHGRYTDIRPRVPHEMDQWKLRHRGRTNLARSSRRRRRRLGGTRHRRSTGNYSNGIHKTSQLPSLRLGSKLGERPRSHTLYIRPFYVARQPVPALYLPDNLTPIYGFARVKSRVSFEILRLNNEDADT